jgi:cyclohexanone monooxygenase
MPLIAKEAEHLYVFQRTPNYTVPAHNALLDPEKVAHVKANYSSIRARSRLTPFGFADPPNEANALDATPEEQTAEYERRWADGGLTFMMSFADLLYDRKANKTAGHFIRGKIHEAVDDPAIAEMLSPDTVVACKRLCVDTGYWETFNRPNVTLVDISNDPIERITEVGLETGGEEYALDAIVFATGFDAMTGALLAIDIRGSDATPLRDKWSAGPVTYLGLMTTGFPNLFTITGPGSPSVLTNMVPSIEQHVDFIADCIRYMQDHRTTRIEPTDEAEDAWVAHVNEIADETLFPTCNSWYLGANVPGKPRVFMPYLGFTPYVEKCEEVVAKGYEGFSLT